MMLSAAAFLAWTSASDLPFSDLPSMIHNLPLVSSAAKSGKYLSVIV